SDGLDVENRKLGGPGVTYNYDGGNKRVMVRGPDPNNPYLQTWEFTMYGIGGQKLATQTCTTTAGCVTPKINVYFGGKLVKAKDVVVVTDRLGVCGRMGMGSSSRTIPMER